MSDIKISIVVPVYNVEKYLAQCIDSLLVQDYKNIEIILIDDGATDSSDEICDKYATEHKNIITFHKENGGLSDARNVGVKNATGDYVLFVDSDDFIENGSLSKIVDVARMSFPDVVFLESRKYMPDETVVLNPSGISSEGLRNKSRDEALCYISSCPRFPISACTKLIKKELFDRFKELEFEKNLLSEDIDWSMKLLLTARTFDHCDCDYYNYRQKRADSISSSVGAKHFADLMYILTKWIGEAKKRPEYEREFIYKEFAYEYPIVLANYGTLKKNDTKSFKKDLKSMSWLLNYRSGRRYTLIKLIYRLCGLKITSLILGTYLKIR